MTSDEFRRELEAMGDRFKRLSPLPKRPQWPQRKPGRRRASPLRRIQRFVLAIAFSHTGTQTGTGSPLSVTATVANSDTVVVGAMFQPTTCAVTSISGGGTYASRAAINNSTTIRAELWSTGASAATASASVAVTFSGTATHAGAMVCTYTGVVALGLTGTNTGSGANPTIAIVTQDSNNFVAAFFCWNNAAATSISGDIRNADDDGIIADAMGDHTVVAAGSCTVTATHNAVAWAACALELRTTSGGAAQPFLGAASYQWGGGSQTVGGGRRRTTSRTYTDRRA